MGVRTFTPESLIFKDSGVFLRRISADYARVKRAFGQEEVERAVEAAKQREQADKARKRPRHSLDRGGR